MRRPFGNGRGLDGVPGPVLGTADAVRVLLIDDEEDEAVLTRSLLARVEDTRYDLDWVETFGEGLAAISRDEHDAYLIDHRLGARTGIELVQEAREAGSLAALIILTGQRDRATDLAAMNAGATDFLLKGRTDAALLDRTLRYSIAHVAMMSALDRSRHQMAGLEEIGRILVQDGPTPATVERVVDLIADRFGLPQIAIYLADGETLQLAGHRGYENPVPSVSRDDASVKRVERARQPLFLPSLRPDTGGRIAAGSPSAGELSVPLLVAGELMGLLNVGSSVATPIGEQDYSAIRLVADRLTSALEVTRERRFAEDRLSEARRPWFDDEPPPGQEEMIDSATSTYRRGLLEPMLEVAIASAGPLPDRKVGLLLVACQQTGPDALARVAAQARTTFGHSPLVRFSRTTLAVLVVSTEEAAARSQAADLMALAKGDGLDVWCGYAALAPDLGANELIAAADASLAFARRIGPGTVIG